ncbi:ABC-2 type transporter family protein isoform 1 [Hibiscus syriacus]|uniref:ABC-2 type transporter family protein isoform 1 n=1 Tax=Hibiscus syriacus TaxID=106335 RepID=A0A6A3BUS5_HIBSY|nr:ABC-2 type transporter family protein isoform 1 [Hibiscus syriacus]
MIVLRRRIHEMTTSNYEPPMHWMEWEREYKKENYDVDVCEAAGYLQTKLMETRPRLALGMALLFLFSLPTSFAIVVHHAMHMIKG